MHWVRRSLPPGVRHAETVRLLVSLARRVDVVYTTGMLGRSSLGSLLGADAVRHQAHGRPRLRARAPLGADGGLARASSSGRQRSRRCRFGVARDFDVRRAAHVVTPSDYLRELAIGWGVPAERVTLLPNPAPQLPELDPRDALRARFGFDGPTLVFAGRLTAQKSLDLGIEAARRAGVALAIAGDGPDRAALERLGYGRFLGPLPRREVLELFSAGDASLLSSAWENFPHTVVEALAVGTPVIATRTGGVGEVLRDGENGLVVEPGDVDALARRRSSASSPTRSSLRRLRADGGALGRGLRARPRVRAARADPGRRRRMKPRVLFVGRTRYRLPLEGGLARKWDALSSGARPAGRRERHRPRPALPPAAAAAARRAGLLRLASGGRGLRAARSFKPDAVVAESPFEAAPAEVASGSRARRRR